MSSPINPYIAGNPIRETEMFFGRQDVFRFVQETLVGRYQDNAIVLYGGRRTGKTSVLYQMGRYLDPRYVPVFVDLQGVSLEGLGEMLWGIARQAARALRRQKGIKLSVPPRDEFASDPEGCFREDFLDPALQALGDDHLLLMLDEAARLHEQVRAGRLESRVFDFLRSLIQHNPRLNFIFSIGSGLEEMQREYALLFNPCQYRKISFLDRDAAEALITEPVEEYYRHAPGVVDRILETTHGQPYYTQLVCNRLFARWARQRGDEVTVSDVQAVLGEAVEQGMASLQYAWEDASDTAKIILAALAEPGVDASRPVSLNDLRAAVAAQGIALSRRAVGGALHELVTQEVLRPVNGGYTFTVDLMRLWVQQYQRLEWVKSKIPLPEETIPSARRDWTRIVLAGVSVVLVFLIALSIVIWRNAESVKLERYATETAVSGTMAALLETIIAQDADGAEQKTLEAQLALAQTQSAEEQSTPWLPTNTPGPTATPTSVGVRLDPAADFCEDNSDFEHACAIAVDLSQNFNFVPPYGEGVDDDFFKIWVKPGLIYGCATSDLSPGVDPNMIVFSGPSFDDAIGGNDDVEPGNFNSAFYYYATYEGWLYLLVGTGDRTPSDIYDSDYTLHCDMAVPATPTSSPTPWSTAEPTRTPPPTATPWPTPEPTPTPPLTATPFLDPTVRLLATPTLAPAVDGQAKVYLPEAFFGGDGSTLIIQLELRNMGTGPFTVELDDISVTSAAGVSELIVVAPRLPWTVQPGQTQVVELQYTRPDASSALLSLLGHSFEISGLQ